MGMKVQETFRESASVEIAGHIRRIKILREMRDRETRELVEQIRALEAQKMIIEAPYNEEIAEREGHIRDIVLDVGMSYRDENNRVVATYRKEYVRETADIDALKGYAVAHEEVLQFIKETIVPASVSIKL